MLFPDYQKAEVEKLNLGFVTTPGCPLANSPGLIEGVWTLCNHDQIPFKQGLDQGNRNEYIRIEMNATRDP